MNRFCSIIALMLASCGEAEFTSTSDPLVDLANFEPYEPAPPAQPKVQVVNRAAWPFELLAPHYESMGGDVAFIFNLSNSQSLQPNESETYTLPDWGVWSLIAVTDNVNGAACITSLPFDADPESPSLITWTVYGLPGVWSGISHTFDCNGG